MIQWEERLKLDVCNIENVHFKLNSMILLTIKSGAKEKSLSICGGIRLKC